MTVEDARKAALALRGGTAPRQAEGGSGVPLFRDFVPDEWLPAYRRRCAQSSFRSANRVLERQLIPTFGRLPLDAIRRTDVERWFDAYGRTAPGGANKALEILGQIMNAPARTVRAIGTHCTGDPAGLVVGQLAKSFEPPPGIRSRSAQVSAVVGWSHESSEPIPDQGQFSPRLHPRTAMIRRHGRDGPQPDLVLRHVGVFTARTAGYYLRPGEDAADLRAKRAEHRNASAWHGQGAAALGLHPGKPVGARAFERLLQGHVIGARIRLGRRRDGQHEHRPGFDITFSAPKSVSLAALLPTKEHPHGDRAVIRAHTAAVRETLDWIEGTLLETRGWDPATGKRPRVKTPWMVAALFRHIASRNLDPQLHTHAVIANMTRDGDGRWKSVEPTLLHRNARLIGAYYRDRLARHLIAKGYSILPAMVGRLPSFELAGYGRELRDAFSTRRHEILAYVDGKGWDRGAKAMQAATLATRKRKAEPVKSQLQQLWQDRAREKGLDTAPTMARSGRPIVLPEGPSTLEIVRRCMRQLEERQSVFPRAPAGGAGSRPFAGAALDRGDSGRGRLDGARRAPGGGRAAARRPSLRHRPRAEGGTVDDRHDEGGDRCRRGPGPERRT